MLLPTAFAFSIGCQGIRHPMMKGNPGGSQVTDSFASNGKATQGKGSSRSSAIVSKPRQAPPAQLAKAPARTTTPEGVVQASAMQGQGGPTLPSPSGSGPAGQVVQASHTARHPSNCACCNSGKYQPVFTDHILNQDPSCSPNGAAGCYDGGNECGVIQAPVFRGYDPQEYLYDGGDRTPAVQVQVGGEVVGLQPEDTVLHYENDKGEVKVEPACRAAIYAPRFASVRKITSIDNKELALGPQAAILPMGIDSVKENLPSPVVKQPLRVAREDGLKVIEAFRDRNRGVPVDNVLPVKNFSDALMPFEDLQLVRNGRLDDTEFFKLKKGVAAALTWSNVDEVQVFVDGKEAAIQRRAQAAQETVLFEVDGKPTVRICKVASQQMAAPGDEIHFTIRVDNVGSQDASNVVILDSLTPRLEYVEGSQKASFEVDFEVADNEVGSSVLKWTLKDKLKALEGGYIRFKCKVR